MRTRLAVVFGGRSGEHDVSIMSAESVISALNPERYSLILVGIGRDGRWWTGPNCLDALRRGRPEEAQPAAFMPDPTGPGLYAQDEAGGWTPVPVDVWFPVLHGPYGEDGTLQGLLDMGGQTYVGCDVTASAVGMDKSLMKVVFAAAGLPQVNYRVVRSAQWRADPDGVLETVSGAIGFPCFVKPASLGSSVGVSRADDKERLRQAMDDAARLASKVVVEQAAIGFREIEIGVLGNDDPIVSVPGEVVPTADYYDYHAKYTDERTQLIVPAPLKPETVERLTELGRAAFKAIDGKGLSRVDFFVSPDERTVYVNEINTMPGFTRVSMYPRVWTATGVSYENLIDRLVALALERDREKRQIARAQETWRPPSPAGSGDE